MFLIAWCLVAWCLVAWLPGCRVAWCLVAWCLVAWLPGCLVACRNMKGLMCLSGEKVWIPERKAIILHSRCWDAGAKPE